MVHAAERWVLPVGEPAVLGRHPWLRTTLFTGLMAVAVLVGHTARLVDTVPVLSPVPALAVLWLAGSPGRGRRSLDACLLLAVVVLVLRACGHPPSSAPLIAVAIAAQGAASARAYRVLRPQGLALRAPRDLLLLAVGAGIGATASTPLALLAFAFEPGRLTFVSGLQWLLHSSVSTAIVLAAVLQVRSAPAGERHRTPRLERCGIALGFSLAYALAFWAVPQYAIVSCLLPVAVWAALRESLRAVTVHTVVACVAVVVAVRSGHDPWTDLPDALQVVTAEVYLGVLALITLVLALYRAEGERNARRVREQADLLGAVFASINDAVTVVDARGHLLLRNQAADDLFGEVDVPGMAAPGSAHGFFRLDGTRTAPEDLPVVQALRGRPVTGVEGRLVSPAHPAGRLVRVSARPLPAAPGAPWDGGAVAALHDVSDLRAATDEVARAHDLFAGVLDAATEHAIVAVDTSGSLTLFNEGAERMLGWSAEEVLGRSVLELHDPADLPQVARQLGMSWPTAFFDGTLVSGARTFRCRYRRRDGSAVAVSLTIAPMHDAAGRLTGFTSMATDITAQLAAERRLTHQALHDGLTGLANRTLLGRSLEEALDAGQPLSLLYLDLDGFKAVNDTAGHAVGDQLLVAVSHLLRGCVREGDTVARLGGDEFAVLCPGAGEDDGPATGRRVLRALSHPVALPGGTAVVGASIGVRWCPAQAGGLSAEQVLREADEAMYAAKRAGKNQVVVHGGQRAGSPVLPVRAGS